MALISFVTRPVTDFQVDVVELGLARHPFRVQVELGVDSTFDYH
jgi:hypothetical protein